MFHLLPFQHICLHPQEKHDGQVRQHSSLKYFTLKLCFILSNLLTYVVTDYKYDQMFHIKSALLNSAGLVLNHLCVLGLCPSSCSCSGWKFRLSLRFHKKRVTQQLGITFPFLPIQKISGVGVLTDSSSLHHRIKPKWHYKRATVFFCFLFFHCSASRNVKMVFGAELWKVLNIEFYLNVTLFYASWYNN